MLSLFEETDNFFGLTESNLSAIMQKEEAGDGLASAWVKKAARFSYWGGYFFALINAMSSITTISRIVSMITKIS